jgi:toxin YoeB
MNIHFTQTGWSDYTYWQTQDRKTMRKINRIIQDIARNGNTGIGKPEPLQGNLSGWWSRRIDEANRLVYRLVNETVEIAQCRSHYGDK